MKLSNKNKNRILLWTARITLPTVFLAVHWVMGISIAQFFFLLLLYIYIPVSIISGFGGFLLLPIALILMPIVLPILKLYGWKEPEIPARSLDDLKYEPETNLSYLIGLEGKSTTSLRPVGKVEIDSTIYDAVTEGLHIEKECMVRIIGCRRNELLVRALLEFDTEQIL